MYRLVLISFLVLSLTACKKSKPTSDPNQKVFNFESLTSDNASLKQGDLTNIKAKVTGDVTYTWAASSGDLLGNGSYIAFGAGSCCTGNHTVTCTVSDSHGNSEAKSVIIDVHI